MILDNLYEYSILVVIYKQSVFDSETLKSLISLRSYVFNSKITIWDNSPTSLPNDELEYLKLNLNNLSYIHTPENIGLAKIYNEVIKTSNDSGYVILFDQDSEFDARYFEMLKSGIIEFPTINLFVPLIMHSDSIMSPGYYICFKGSLWKEIKLGKVSSKNMAIITSGMAISSKYLSGVFKGFDEEFVFYGIDTYFSIQYRDQNDFFYVFDCNFKHDLAINSDEKYDDRLRRFKNHRKSLIKLSKRSVITYLATIPYVSYKTVKFYLSNLLKK